jgi:glutaredoxin 3
VSETFIIWGKDQCPMCDQAKNLLKSKGLSYEERNLSAGVWTREQLLEAVPDARSVPQIFVNETHLGGFSELRQYLQEAV